MMSIPVFVLLLSIRADASSACPSIADNWSLEQVRHEIDARRARLRSLFVEGNSVSRVAVTPDGVMRERHVVFAAAGPDRYEDSGHVNAGLSWQDDPSRTKSYLTGDGITVFWVMSRICETSRLEADAETNAKLGRLRCDLYLECTGWWPPGDESPDRLVPRTALHKTLRIPGYRLLAGTTLIRDHACLVVELPGKDTLWLAPQHGMALVRREMTDMTGQIQVVYENGDFRELEKDLWLPGNVSRVVWRRSGDQRAVGEPRIWSQTSRTLVQLRVNDLAPALFQCKLPPGTIVVDKDSKKWHQLPGGLEMLDGVVRAAMSLSISAGRRLPASRYTFAPVGVLMALGAAPWVAIAIGRARKRHQMRRQEQQ